MSDLLTPDDLAAKMQVRRTQVMEWNRTQKWPHVRLGNAIRWTPEQAEQIIRDHVVIPEKPKALPGQTGKSAARSK